MKARIVTLPGDGIGPEVTAEAVRVLQVVSRKFGHQFEFAERLMGGCSIDRHGTALTDAVMADCKASDAVLLGAVGGPKWDDPQAKVRPEQGLLALRKGLGVFANLRPVRVNPSLVDASPLKPDRLKGVDILVIRELTGGLYFGQPKGRDRKDGHERAVDTLEYQDFEVRRVVELAFRLAWGRRRKVTSVDKANVLESSRLWRQIASAVGKEQPEVALRGVASDGSNPAGTAYLVSTTDKARNVRAAGYHALRTQMQSIVPTEIVEANALEKKSDVLFYFTGLTHVPSLDSNTFLPGAIGDHLTSAGGVLFGGGQMSSLRWLEAGATGSYGAVVEPCNYPAKFPIPAVVMAHYLQGETLIETYWKSVQMPGQRPLHRRAAGAPVCRRLAPCHG